MGTVAISVTTAGTSSDRLLWPVVPRLPRAHGKIPLGCADIMKLTRSKDDPGNAVLSDLDLGSEGALASLQVAEGELH